MARPVCKHIVKRTSRSRRTPFGAARFAVHRRKTLANNVRHEEVHHKAVRREPEKEKDHQGEVAYSLRRGPEPGQTNYAEA